jgi:predicted transcriptional regulator
MFSESFMGPMTGAEIARNMGITRQAVSMTLKIAMEKVYYNVQDLGLAENPVDAVLYMREWFNITNTEEIRDFFQLFPKPIQEEIRDYARANPIE